MDRRNFGKVLGAAGLGGGALPAAGPSALASMDEFGPPSESGFRVRRLEGSPIIRPGMSGRLDREAERYGYVNINGPSLIRVPEWADNPLGKYYLYFAHHKGEFIRMAHADSLAGPWRVHEPGALELADSFFPAEDPGDVSLVEAGSGLWKRYPPQVAWALTSVGLKAARAVGRRRDAGNAGSEENHPHIASPDVIVDHEARRIRMYYHGMLPDLVQMTRVALSADGVNFEARPELLASPYLRVFRFRDEYFGVGMPGILYRSEDGLTGFKARRGLLFGSNMRHTAVLRRGELLYLFFTRVGDAPERILCSAIDMGPRDWNKWRPSAPREVLRPETEWEGAGLPVEPSLRGEVTVMHNQLRDPAIFEESGKTYLLYACAGEHGIAIAELAGPGE